MKPIAVGLLGPGTVGGGVLELLDRSAELIARRAGRPIVVRAVAARDPSKPREPAVDPSILTDDPFRVARDPEIDVVVELMGGIEPARSVILEALAAGKHVVTANKAVLADHGAEIFEAARSAGGAVAFEAAVGGGIPIVNAFHGGLAANAFQSVAAILNGTCNYILTQMTEGGLSYETALSQAQALGYAEADPTLDVNGTDTAHKLAILANLAFETIARTEQIPRLGIDTLSVADIRYAAELGYAVKLLALANRVEGGLSLRVAPTLVRHGTPLADVRGPYNAIRVVGDAVGDALFYGRGAGRMPTASAVVADLIDVASGRAELTVATRKPWLAGPEALTPAEPSQVRSRYYLRFQIADRPGVLARIARRLGERDISIASVIQHDPGEDRSDRSVPLVVMTHSAREDSILEALDTIDRMEVVAPPSVRLGVLD